ncbi:ABC transporter substrate-binding protein [Sulfurimonas marina]|uniref:histidine kinase n=1 Tax=Sulfurimonas marina TaxID=2590551 RepID=A0A7M1AUN9_9BACT|nr:ABC transporter substrate-binding protein [Sulfurimonas marina]QOP41096.1 transporter substrate-binding domain-containing protein [Sulfurimonas marina]
MMKALLILCLFVLSLHGNLTEEKELEKISLQLHWKYQFEYAGFIAAKEKGFYKDVGLDVEFLEYNKGIDIEEAVLRGKATYGIYNSSTMIDYLRGKPIKLVASFFKRAALVLITKPNIKSPEDLKGKTIMAAAKKDFLLNFKPFLDVYGISVDDMRLVPHTYSIDDFMSSKVDGMTAFVSDQVYKLDNEGIKYNILDPSNDNLFVLQMELFTTDNEVKNHPKRVLDFRNASIKGWQYALSHKKELVEIIHKKYAPNISKSDLLDEAKGIEKLILPYTYDIGSIDKNFLSKQMEFFKKEYKLDPSKDLSNFVFNYEYIDKSLCLTSKEKEYIKKHPVIDVCIHNEQFPIDGIDKGKMTGVMSDIFNDISQTTSLSFRAIASKSHKELNQKLRRGECQILSIYATSSKDHPTVEPTQPFMNIHFTLLGTLDKSFVIHPDNLEGKKIVVQMESYKNYLLSLYPHLDIVVENDKNKMVKMVLSSKVHALAALDFQADYLIDKYGYGKLKITGFLAKNHPISTSIGIQKDEPVLASIIGKGLAKISQDRIDNILNEWRITRYHQSINYSLVIATVIIMGLILLVMIYYQRKLKNFNKELENQVAEQTKLLREYNHSLEETVEEKAQELIKKDELLTMQSKQAVMGEMISMIAHQWRQPLNTITLQISNMQLKYLMEEKLDKDEVIKTFEAINSTILYLSETIDDFKTYFRKDKELVDVSLKELIEKALNLIRPRLKDVQVHLYIAENIRAKVYFNELVQVVLNILNNAIDAYDTCKTCSKEIHISVKQKENMNVIHIEDNAGGIKEAHLEKLFEPYFSTKGKNGTGLGLYMSQMIIEKQFGGFLKVDTYDDKTNFKIYLPITYPVSP